MVVIYTYNNIIDSSLRRQLTLHFSSSSKYTYMHSCGLLSSRKSIAFTDLQMTAVTRFEPSHMNIASIWYISPRSAGEICYNNVTDNGPIQSSVSQIGSEIYDCSKRKLGHGFDRGRPRERQIFVEAPRDPPNNYAPICRGGETDAYVSLMCPSQTGRIIKVRCLASASRRVASSRPTRAVYRQGGRHLRAD